METVIITQEDARTLRKILNLLNDSARLLIHEASLRIDNVTLEWKKDVVRLTIKDPPAKGDVKEV